MRRKNTWCLAIITGIFCLMLTCAAAQNISVNYPSQTTYGQAFSFSITLLNFTSDVYDVKIDITNSSGDRLGKILNGGSWQSTYNYVGDAINTSSSNSSSFSLNITEQFNGTANIEIKVRDSSSNIETFSGYALNVMYQSQNSSENQSQQNPTSQPAAVNLSVDYDDEVESQGFNVTIRLYNLKNMKYDIKVYITFEENDTIISQTFDGSWKSSTYYIIDAVEGPGSETSEIKMRIKDEYSNFEGDARITVRIRESETENSAASFEDSITIKKSEVSNGTSSNQGTVSLNLVRDNSSQNTPGITSNVIKLNSQTANTTKDIKSNIYKSKVEYFKQYGIYAFAIVCVAVIFVLLKKKKE